jgi:hypothetical protein
MRVKVLIELDGSSRPDLGGQGEHRISEVIAFLPND